MKSRNLFFILIAFVLCLTMTLVGCNNGNNGNNGNNTDVDNHTYYTVTFDSCGGSSVESQRVMEGNTVRNPEAPTRETYSFIGWYKKATDNAEQWDFSTDRVNSDITLYAKWQSLEVHTPTTSLTFSRNSNGYTVTGATGQEERMIIPAEHDNLPVTEIGESAFAYSTHTSDITYVSIPDSVTKIGLNAFHNRSELVAVDIGGDSNLSSIDRNAFSGNGALKAIYIPKGVIEIGDGAFNNCGSLDSISVAAANTIYSSEGNCLIEIATHTLIRGSNNSQIPESVTVIASAAFRKVNKMTSLSIPVTVTTIGDYFIADSTITTVRYQGTEEQWLAIEKSATMWNYGNRNVEVVFGTSATTENKILIAYFSATNNTENIAKHIADITNSTLYEILPKIPYTSADLNYNTDCRANREQNDSTARPEISRSVENMSQYDTIFIGYPIWWGQAPKIMYTFLESYDFAGKTIIPFCTSGSSGIGSSATNLSSSASDATWLSGQRFSGSASKATVENWINGLNLNIQKEQAMKISVKSGSIEIIYQLNDSKAAKGLYAQLPLTIAVEPYSNNEIIFYPKTLDTSDTPLAEGGAGSLAYYAPWGDVVLFYGSFSSNGSLFELGKIVSGIENIKNLSGTVTITAC